MIGTFATVATTLCVMGAAPLVPQEPVFSRPEPHLAEGFRHLKNDDADAALTAFRQAKPATPDERAMVEYDVGQALVLKAQIDAKAAPEAGGGPPPVDVADARAAFDRASSMAIHPALKSEAALASGNAAALAGKLDDAISAFRKAIIADATNTRAKTNLRRVLDAKRAQPPPAKKEGGEGQDGEGEDKDKKEQKDQQSGDGDKEEKKDEKQDQQKQDQQGQGGDEDKDQKPKPKDGEGDQDKQKQEQESQGGEQKDDKKEKEQKPPTPQPAPQDGQKKQKQEQARRLLDALRSREKPLSPMEMRGTTQQRPKDGKDW